MEPHRLLPGSTAYPAGLARSRKERPPILTCRGNPELLRLPLLGVLTSSDPPPDLVLPSLDLMSRLREARAPVIGGFQSMLETHCLQVLLKGAQPVVVTPARSVDGMKVRREWEERVAAGSMLLVSPFGAGERRASVRLAMQRNLLVAEIADQILVMHAGVASRAYRAAEAALEMGKRVFCFDHRRNRDLLLLGAWAVEPSVSTRGDDAAILTLAGPACR